jgi:hypothetical protein
VRFLRPGQRCDQCSQLQIDFVATRFISARRNMAMVGEKAVYAR